MISRKAKFYVVRWRKVESDGDVAECWHDVQREWPVTNCWTPGRWHQCQCQQW